MNTIIYFVRHGDSPKVGEEYSRGLTEKGLLDRGAVTEILLKENIQTIISSPYQRAILTIEPLAKKLNKEILIIDDLKERVFTSENNRMTDGELNVVLKSSFAKFDFALDGGESNSECQKRAIKVILTILSNHSGERIVIGTHALIMTLIIHYFNSNYSLEFLHSTTKPDIYKLEFEGNHLINIERLR